MNKNIDWNNKEFLEEVIAKSTSKKDVLENIGYNSKSSTSGKKLNAAISRFNISIDHFLYRSNGKTRWEEVEQELRKIVAEEISYAAVLVRLGKRAKSGNYDTLKKYLKIYDIDTSHFKPYKREPRNKISLTEILEGKHPSYKTSTLKERLYKAGLKKKKCEECGITDWNDKAISLELDHINGVSDDHNYNNLRILCPNCHSQTPTFKAKNIKRN